MGEFQNSLQSEKISLLLLLILYTEGCWFLTIHMNIRIFELRRARCIYRPCFATTWPYRRFCCTRILMWPGIGDLSSFSSLSHQRIDVWAYIVTSRAVVVHLSRFGWPFKAVIIPLAPRTHWCGCIPSIFRLNPHIFKHVGLQTLFSFSSYVCLWLSHCGETSFYSWL